MRGAPLPRVIGVAAVVVLDLRQDLHRAQGGLLEQLVLLRAPGRGQARQTPGALGRDALVEHGVAQVGAGVAQAGLAEGLQLRREELLGQFSGQEGQGVGAGAPVDDRVRAVEGVVAPGPEGEAGARPLAHEVVHQPPALLQRHLDQLPAPVRVPARQHQGRDDRTGALARVLDPVLRTQDATLLVAQGEQPVEGAREGALDRVGGHRVGSDQERRKAAKARCMVATSSATSPRRRFFPSRQRQSR